MKTSYTEEALADIVSALTYFNDRSPAAAAKLDADIEQCVDRLAAQEFDGPVSRLKSGAHVRGWAVPPLRIFTNVSSKLLIVRIYNQARRPITR